MSEVTLVIPFQGNYNIFLDEFDSIYPSDPSLSGQSASYQRAVGFSSSEKPVTCTELFSKLQAKGWGRSSGRFIMESGSGNALRYRTYSPDDLPNNCIDVINTGYVALDGTSQLDDSFEIYPKSHTVREHIEEQELKEKIDNIFGSSMSGDEVVFHDSSKVSVDVLDHSFIFDLILPQSGIYTNTLDLNEIIKYSSTPGLMGTANITVLFSKSGNVYSKNMIFQVFRYKTDGSLAVTEFEEEFMDVKVCFYSGVIEVFPLTPEVNEYIISNCTVVYGKI